jgi:hypothetical protein
VLHWITVATKNITLSLPEELVRRAKVLAAQRDTSVSSLVARLLEQLVGDIRDYDEVWATERRLMSDGVDMRVGPITWSRAHLHER